MGKVKDYVKKHKDVVPYVIGAGAGLLIIALGMKAKSKATNTHYEELDHPSMDEGTFSYYMECHSKDELNGTHLGHMKDVPVSNLGKVGDTLKQCDGIDENSKISFMFVD